MLPCEKRRHIIRRERDGSQQDGYRCAHGMSTTYGHTVQNDICQQCVLRIAGLTKFQSLCKQTPPSNPIYKQPTLGSNFEIMYQEQPGVEPPACPDGHHPDPDNPWHFISDWLTCPMRVFNNQLSATGELIVRAVCALVDKPVGLSECLECGGKILEVLETPPEYPALKTQAANYWAAIKRWIKSGRPERSEEDVKKIHTNFCEKCDWFDREASRCRGCGCKVTSEGAAVLNKIRMQTEHCPRGLW